MSSEEPGELTERQKLCRRLANARKYHRFAVRWLFDVSRLAAMYKEDHWREGSAGEISQVANQDHEDALKEVIQTRQLIDNAAQKLKEYDSEQ